MNRRIPVIAAAALALTLGALPLAAQSPGRGRGGPGGPGPMGILPGLNQVGLSDAQREQVRAILEEERQSGRPGEELRSAEQALNAAVLADTPNPGGIESAKAALASAQAGELDHRVQVMQKVAAVLTAAQRQQLAQFQPPPGPRGRGPGGL